MPEIPVDPTSLDLPAEYRQFLRSGWLASFALGLAEKEGYELVHEVSSNPSAERIRLELLESKAPSLIRHLRWIHSATSTLHAALTYRLMRQVHIKEDLRPVLAQKEIKRRKIEGRFLHAARALNLVYEKCRTAQRALTTGLAESGDDIAPSLGGRQLIDMIPR